MPRDDTILHVTFRARDIINGYRDELAKKQIAETGKYELLSQSKGVYFMDEEIKRLREENARLKEKQ